MSYNSASVCRACRSKVSIEERFSSKFEISADDDCWLWMGAKQSGGYGVIQGRHRADLQLAHRVAWTIVNGDIPIGLQIDHLCGRKDCVNPDHLEPVTPLENTRRYHASLS